MEKERDSDTGFPFKYLFTAAAAAVVGYGVYRLVRGKDKRSVLSRSGKATSRGTEHSLNKQQAEHSKVSSAHTIPSKKNHHRLLKKHVSWIPGLRVREQKILHAMPAGKPVRMSDIALQFKDVTDRTLRRDFNQLLRKGRIRRTGTTRSTTYVRV